MLADDHERSERGRRALRQRLALDFEPLRDTLARGLGVPVQVTYAAGPPSSLPTTKLTADGNL